MKSSNTVVTIVVVGAVLVAAYALGLLIRQARVEEAPSSTASPVEVNEARLREAAYEPGTGRIKSSQEAKAQLKEKRAENLKKMETATDEEKARVREQVRERVGTQPDRKVARRPVPRRTETVAAPAAPDPNVSQNPEKTDSEPNRAGES